MEGWERVLERFKLRITETHEEKLEGKVAATDNCIMT